MLVLQHHFIQLEKYIFKTEFNSSCAGEVEEWIDSHTAHPPPLENFILPVLFTKLFSFYNGCFNLF